MEKFDAGAFAADLKAARDATKPSEKDDADHLSRISLWTTVLGVVGLLLCGRGVLSPIGMLAVGVYKFAKFAILAHHSLHGGWGRERRGWFGMTPMRRVLDWLDWIFPQAWIAEHNKVHHYYLNENEDPDFVERNLEPIQNFPVPLALKYTIVLINAMIWKWFYYASNTLKLLHAGKPGTPGKEELDQSVTIMTLVTQAVKGNPWYRALALDLIFRVLLPPFAIQFFAVPAAAGLLRTGSLFCFTTFMNIVGAEIVTNIWAFVTIVTNHAGSDLWWFATSCKADTPEFYLRAILGSTAYSAGNDVIDYLHGYLNYQGEHHAFPELSPLHYQRLHPVFKQVCAKYGVPYIQETCFMRTKKTADICVGVAKHKRLTDGHAVDQPDKWRISN